ncbi:PAS domain S-box protein [Azoarcus sp. DN11]|uniref:PAS domain S-box protein n=1 Tax=Azoarcus sp. DN11 TaxID=356837 RepID=UPI0013E3FF32|nr:PAS domain S-box protein [Azoarcus sp. DN11]
MTRAISTAHAQASVEPEPACAEVASPGFDPATGRVNKLWARILLVAAIYALAALASRLLAASPGFAASLWPPAGVALACLILFGIRSFPGVWLGALLFNLLFTPATGVTGALSAAFCATGATLQAVLGAWFARRYLRSPFALASHWRLVRILLLVGPVACIVSPTFGTGALVGLARLAPASAADEWLAAWAGDTIGVLLFAPLGLLVMPGARPAWVASGRSGFRVAVTLLATAILLGVGGVGVHRIEAERKRAGIALRMDEVVELGFLPLPNVVAMLEGVERFISANAALTPEGFAAYTRWITRHPALSSVDWAPRVTREQRAAFESAARAGGLQDYRIFEPDADGTPLPVGERAEYYPVLFTEPLEKNRMIVGLDHAFDFERMAEMRHASESGSLHLMHRSRLLRTVKPSLLVFQRVLAKDAAGAAEAGARDREIRGYVVGVYDVEALLAPLLDAARARGVLCRVRDVTGGGTAYTLVDGLTADVPPLVTRDIEIAGHSFRLEMQPGSGFDVTAYGAESHIFHVFSVLVALLVSFGTLSTAGYAAGIERTVAKRTAELEDELQARRSAEDERDRLFNLPLDLLGIAGVDGYFKRVNPAFRKTLGWSDDELLAHPFLDFVHPDDRAATQAEMGRLAEGIPTQGFENRYRCKDGSWRRLEWKALPQPDGLIFCSATDGTERHEHALRLGQLNAVLARRVEEHTAAMDALREKKEELRVVLDHLFDCVITIDERGVVQRANPAIHPVLGYAPEEVVGQNVAMLMPSPDSERHDGYLRRYLKTGERSVIGTRREVEGRHKLGHTVALELSVAEYSIGKERFFIGTLHDITKRKTLIAALQQARDDAEQASRAKSAFLAAMSHEIRTPMNGVVGLVEVLAHTGLTEQQADLIATIRSSSSTLLGIIDDILDFSKIEAGRLELDAAPVALEELAEGLATSLAPVANGRDVDLSIFVAPDLPRLLVADEMRVRQILYNLVGNAIKFSAGRPGIRGRVGIRVTMAQRDPLCVAIAVSDNGIGIAPDKVNELFHPFTQAETSTTRRFGGTGLGLAICRRLVALMNGDVTVESRPGEGARFTVTLPLEPASDAQSAQQGTQLGGVGCILIDDAELSTDDLRIYLEHAGAQVQVAADVGSAAAAVRALGAPAIVIGFVGHGANEQRIAEALDGVRRVCIKRGRRQRPRISDPFTVTIDGNALRRQTLLRAVAVAAGLASPETFQSSQPVPEQAATLTMPDVEQARREGRLVLVADDDEINRKVMIHQLALLGYAAELAGDGAEALQMWRKGRYALVLADIHMPEMDGYRLTESIRCEEGDKGRIPIVAVTANALRGEERRAYAAGMDGYLTKPVLLDTLSATIRQWLPDGEVPPAAGPPVQRVGLEPTGDLPLLDLSTLAKLVGEEETVIREFLQEFAESARGHMATMEDADARGELHVIAATAHMLKSSARAVGALLLGDVCAALEEHAKQGDRTLIAKQMARLTASFEATMARVIEDLSAETLPLRGEVR